MSIKSDYKDYEEHRNRIAGKKTGKFFINQELRYVKPFQIYGNLYYVGDSWVCVHIVDTGEGLLMFDAGNCGAQAVLIQSIWEMGFNPADVKWIILSHGHVDHFGAVNFFKNMFGTKIYMGEPDVKMFREHPELTMIQESGNCMDTLFHVTLQSKKGIYGHLAIRPLNFIWFRDTRKVVSCVSSILRTEKRENAQDIMAALALTPFSRII